MKIIYESNAGHTEEYAKMLANKLKLECISLKEYKKDDEQIIFLGWVYANNIQGYKQVKDSSNILCTIAVGMNFESDKNTNLLIETNNIKEKFFYLQGGVDYKRLKGIKKIMFKLVAESVIKENKPEDRELIEILQKENDCIKEENLNDILAFINGGNK